MILIGGISAIVGFIVAYIVTRPNAKKIEKNAILEAERIRKNAQYESDRALEDARKQAEQIRKNIQKEESQSQKRIDEAQAKMDNRMEKRETLLEEKIAKAEESKIKHEDESGKLRDKQRELNQVLEAQNEKFAEIAKLSQDEAREQILKRMEESLNPQLVELQKRKLELVREEAEKEGSNIIVQAIQRFASPMTSETTTSVVRLKSDDLKGKIIGREGRNINAFEMIAGVDLIIDDAPGTVTISSYDKFRRYVAKVALEELLKDGRIHPASIEAAVQKAENKADQMILDIGKKAAEEVNVSGFPNEILKLVGGLRFRTSYGQNVLSHSQEVAWLSAGIAEQLPGADVEVCRKAGLVHDIGKAVSHEVEGGHAIIGKDILEKFGVDKAIVDAMKSHHEDFPYETLESRILQAADAISASRPGARRETLEKYIKRLKALENIAGQFDGVKKAYCIQAGREVRAFVNADTVNDAASQKLSYEMAREIEAKCDYPGEVKVTIIRERRYVDKAR